MVALAETSFARLGIDDSEVFVSTAAANWNLHGEPTVRIDDPTAFTHGGSIIGNVFENMTADHCVEGPVREWQACNVAENRRTAACGQVE
jgi:hypothetical protein